MAANSRSQPKNLNLATRAGPQASISRLILGTKLTLRPFITWVRHLSTWLMIENRELATEKPWLPGYYLELFQTRQEYTVSYNRVLHVE